MSERTRTCRRRVEVAVAVAAALIVTACSAGGSDAGAERRDPTTAGSSPPEVTSAGATLPVTATPSTAATTTTPPRVEVTLAFSGDILTHLPVVGSARAQGAASGAAYDFGPLLAPMAEVVSGADLALCHLEVPLVGDGQGISGYPSFHAPRELAPAIAATGYDGCSTASNHSLDGGMPGIVATLDTFDLVGLGHTGTARSAEESATPRLYDVGGASIAHLSYAYGFNGYQLPQGAPWAANGIDPQRIAADALTARAAGAHLVVVSLHWGTEYASEPDAGQEAWAAEIAAIPAVDLLIGHHAHVVQPIQQVDGTWVVFGLGNHLSNQAQDPRRDGLTVEVAVGGPVGGPLAVERIEAVPTWVDLAGHRVLPAAETLADPGLDPGLRAALEASVRRTMEVVNRRGAGIPVAAWT